MTISQVLADQVRRTREWTLMLLTDIEGDDWFYQPQPGMQHALWICGHLTSAQDTLLFTRVLNKPVLDDGFKEHFPIGGPVKSKAENDWPQVADVRKVMDETQAKAEAAITGLSDAVLAEHCPGKDGAVHPHYVTKLGAISHLARHEAFHAGQLATIRRMLGRSFLR